VDRLVADVDTLVGAHLEGLLHRVGGLRGPDGQDGDLPLALLDQLEGGLDGVLVELGQEPVHALPVGRAVGLVEGAVGLGVRHVLDAHDDVHGRPLR